MTIFLTGGSGKTARRIAELIVSSSHPVLVGSRRGAAADGLPAVVFNWDDPSTFKNPFDHAARSDSPIKAVYLVSPGFYDGVYEHMTEFIDLAKGRGVRRFVFLSASSAQSGETLLGQLHAYLCDLGVEWMVLRPTWFQGALSRRHDSIKEV